MRSQIFNMPLYDFLAVMSADYLVIADGDDIILEGNLAEIYRCMRDDEYSELVDPALGIDLADLCVNEASFKNNELWVDVY